MLLYNSLVARHCITVYALTLAFFFDAESSGVARFVPTVFAVASSRAIGGGTSFGAEKMALNVLRASVRQLGARAMRATDEH